MSAPVIRSAPALRTATAADLTAIVRTLTVAFGEPLRADTWEWLDGLPEGEIVVAERRRSIVGTAAGLSFAATGWIGGLGVEPRSRRRGIATALTDEIVDWLRERGARTLLLQATDQGRPVYERLGFEAEGAYRMWSLPPWRGPRPPVPGTRPLRRADFRAVCALDREATGEDRAIALRAAWPSGGVALDGRDGLRGFHLDSPWGPGPTVAADADAGLALLGTARRPEEAVRLGVPAANAPAADALRAAGHEEVAPTERMRLGPPVPWAPERVFGVFNPFWG